MPYIGQSPDTIVSRNSFNEFNFTAINTQVTFTGADNNNNTLEYNPGNVEVFLNGVRLEEADFTATNGTSVVLASGATAGDLLSIKAIIVFQVGDAVSKSSGGTFANNVSVTGTLTATSFSGFGGNLTGVNSDVVDDTSPQLGGDLYANGKRIIFYETDYQNGEALVFANSTNNPYGTMISRQNILHDFYIANHEGSIRLVNHEADKDIELSTDDGTGSTATYLLCDGSTGEVKLYHYGSEKFATKSNGISVTGAITSDGVLDLNANAGNVDITSVGGTVTLAGDTSDMTFTNSGTGKFVMTGSTSDAYLKVYTASASQGARGLTIGSSSENDWFIERSASNNDLKFYYNPSTRMKITSNGVIEGASDAEIKTSPIRIHSNTISTNTTIASTENAVSGGPITIANGVTVTVDGDWTVV